jgi:hypothetical protein
MALAPVNRPFQLQNGDEEDDLLEDEEFEDEEDDEGKDDKDEEEDEDDGNGDGETWYVVT